jgi:hypothetical protein
MLHGQTFYVGNVTLEGVRKPLNGKPHHPPYSSSSKYVLITHSASVFQSELCGIEFRAFLKKNMIDQRTRHVSKLRPSILKQQCKP